MLADLYDARADKREIEAQGYEHVRLLPTGEWAGIKNLVYCFAICVGMKPRNGWTAMFCFDGWDETVAALDSWSGRGFPPGFRMPNVPQAEP